MHVISYKHIREFSLKHPDGSVALRAWYKKMERIAPSGMHELKLEFVGVDYVGNNRYVFNIKGNKYRIVALLLFNVNLAFIRFIGTHAEYERINCRKI